VRAAIAVVASGRPLSAAVSEGRPPSFLDCGSQNLVAAGAIPVDLQAHLAVAPSGGAATCVDTELAAGADELRSSASSSTWHGCFARASDTVVIAGQTVAGPRCCICTPGNWVTQRAHW